METHDCRSPPQQAFILQAPLAWRNRSSRGHLLRARPQAALLSSLALGSGEDACCYQSLCGRAPETPLEGSWDCVVGGCWGLRGTDPAQQWCSRTSDAGHEDGQVCTCSVWDVSVPLSLAINCQLPKDNSVLTRLAVCLRSQPVPDATLVLGSVPEVAVGLLSRGTWLQPPQVHGQGVTMGKGERGVWGCGEAAGRCLGAGAGDAGVSSSEG